jgi:hypothetical protein
LIRELRVKTLLGDLGLAEKIILMDLEKKNLLFGICFLLVSLLRLFFGLSNGSNIFP